MTMYTMLQAHEGHVHEGFDLLDILLHSLTDTAKMLPFLFAAYLVIEYLERRKSSAVQRVLARGGRWGFVPGAVLGVVPQCGFSAMAANFYASRVITLGTLLAVFLATSDEAIPVMLAQPDRYGEMLLLIAVKLGYALLVGFVVDVALRRFIPAGLRGGFENGQSEEDCHHHDEKDNLWWAAIKHTLNIFLVVLAFTFVFGVLVEWLGEDNISGFLAGLGPFQPIMAALFGLVPNCASSVLLTQLYLSGGISFGSVLAGLCANAGIGLTVLFRANKSVKQNLFITGLQFALGTGLGLAVHLVFG